ncbi:nickel pincer cofactor biosynthesis protein LarB [Chondromyces crocatus]|uniref:1-(5-phosphoribosyl)-5-amino-4-imidazole-carboxylate carboxylase n=1 Tax=Chondromyces crocatus TaxID=52 RepID=A0A0K1EEW7_CHOCO|nr:nickel pincer cofactor biosynthesis protein LarB [Chondromyces crocatus]AKT39399.1 1-(5-phosphoribosyl)-5-amino-4-imidazole- carboxylate carboxylase [Chondromyces crocatus]
MDPRDVRELLERVRSGDVTVESALEGLQELPFRDIGVAAVDHHRALRQGVPEIIFGQGKTPEQIIRIAEEILRTGQNVLVTRIEPEKAERITAGLPGFSYSSLARTGKVAHRPAPERLAGPVAVITAGTSDIPIAEEAVETLLAVGLQPDRVYDVGVAGLHRLLSRSEQLRRAAVVIVIAGMEGALPSVVGGLVAAPVIAVPTSVGYGAALGGFTALFSMLTSCASGVVVVNIDSGFGAAMAAHRMLLDRGQ